MQRSSIQQSSQEIERLECTNCGEPMWLTHIEPDEPDHDRRTFECLACGNSKTEIVKFR